MQAIPRQTALLTLSAFLLFGTSPPSVSQLPTTALSVSQGATS